MEGLFSKAAVESAPLACKLVCSVRGSASGSPAGRAGELMTLQGAIRVTMEVTAEAPGGGLPWGCRLLGSERDNPCRNVWRNSGIG